MYINKKILCVIPARGGSQGIKKKNLYPFLGYPLIYYSVRFAQNLGFVDKIIVSTDSSEIMNYVNTLDVSNEYERPSYLSGPEISDKEVIKDVLKNLQENSINDFDFILYLQPTSPLRRKEDLYVIFDMMISKDLESVWTVSEVDLKYHPLKQLVINAENNIMLYNYDGINITARQQLNKTFIRNGVAYLFTPNFILSNRKLMPIKTGYHIIRDEVISIDDLDDLKLAERLYSKGKYE